MAMTKAEFQNAFRAAVSAEFRHIPENEYEIQHEFSPAFMKRMEKLFRRQKRFYWSFVNTGAKRVAVVFLAAALLFATACSIPPVRKWLSAFAVEVYESFSRFSPLEAEGSLLIETEHLPPIPDGFEETDRFLGKETIRITYENTVGDKIMFSQRSTKNSQITLDGEKGGYRVETVDGKEILIWENGGYRYYVWMQENYQFRITTDGEVSNEIILEMISQVS